MKKTFFALLMAFPLILNAEPDSKRSENIHSWKEITPHKGYILSLDLQNNQHCDKIWSKQMKEFLKKNPHVKDPDKLSTNKTIWVQSCKEELNEITTSPAFIAASPEKKKEILSNWFVGIYTGYQAVGSTDTDTDKTGFNLGIKLGYAFVQDDTTVSLAFGYMFSQMETNNLNNALGAYRVRTNILTVEGDYLFHIGNKVKLGPSLMLMSSEDVSWKDVEKDSLFALFGGVNFLYSFSKKLQLEIKLLHRVSDLERLDFMSNMGMRYNF